jgi:hypothetical protein
MIDLSIYILFVVNMGWKRDSLQMMIFLNVCTTCSVHELKTRVETRIARNDVNGVYWFNISYLITVSAYLCSHWAPPLNINYFVFHWSFNRIFVPNKARKRDSLQMVIFEYVCSTFSVFEVKTRFET